MKITDISLLSEYQKIIGNTLTLGLERFDWLWDTTLEYLTQTGAVYSSNIEWNTLDVNSFMNHEIYEKKSEKSRDVEEINNLIEAYEFAQQNPLTEVNILHCHQLASRTLLIESKQGKYREEKVGVFGSSGLIYLAVEHEKVSELMRELFAGIEQLTSLPVKVGWRRPGGSIEANNIDELKSDIDKIFYHASLLHLVFAHIHPFADGNGRLARLLEKWFLATIGGEKYWRIPSEQYYKEHRPEYYNNINLWVNFYELDYSKALPFLGMLAKSVIK